MSTPDVAEFDRWYGVVADSPGFGPFVAGQLRLPSSLVTTGYVGGAGLAEIAGLLDLGDADTLVDLGCGRAGHSLALVRETGARLIGVDFSATALRGAAADAAAVGWADRATFHRADLAATGLPAGTASAVICLDALQFAVSVPEALAECCRLLAPGAPVIISSWQPSRLAGMLPERFRRMDLHRDLRAAGFAEVSVRERPAWSAAEVALWTTVLDLDPGGDPGLEELRREAEELLPLAPSLQRVLAVARRPV